MIPGPVCDGANGTVWTFEPPCFPLEISCLAGVGAPAWLMFNASKGSVSVAVADAPLLAGFRGNAVAMLDTELLPTVCLRGMFIEGLLTAPSAIMMGEMGGNECGEGFGREFCVVAEGGLV